MRPRLWFPLLVALVACGRTATADDGGWGHLIDKLTADGVAAERVLAAFEDPRVGRFSGVLFSPDGPRESRAIYRRFLRPRGVSAARRCRALHARAFEQAEREHGVSAGVLAAILYVESGCGRNTGRHRIFTRLARLAMANAPGNVARNIKARAGSDGAIDPAVAARIRDRARYLEETFYPEVRALFTVAERLGVDPLDMRGSRAGAFGYPQFLPTSYLSDGVDADQDGQVRLDEPADAIASCARYLARRGWQPGLSRAERKAVIWQYNRSHAYVDTILTLAARIEAVYPPRTAAGAQQRSARQAPTPASRVAGDAGRSGAPSTAR